MILCYGFITGKCSHQPPWWLRHVSMIWLQLAVSASIGEEEEGGGMEEVQEEVVQEEVVQGEVLVVEGGR